MRDATNAYAYGDQAGGGIVELTPFTNGSNAEIATIGSDTIARAQVGSDSSAVAVGSFSNDEESRQRGDLFASWPLGAQESLTVTGGSEQGREYESPGSAFAGSFSFADAAFSDPQALNLTVTAVMDRGDYETSSSPLSAYESPASVAWSDSGFDAAIHSSGPDRSDLSRLACVRQRASTMPQALPYDRAARWCDARPNARRRRPRGERKRLRRNRGSRCLLVRLRRWHLRRLAAGKNRACRAVARGATLSERQVERESPGERLVYVTHVRRSISLRRRSGDARCNPAQRVTGGRIDLHGRRARSRFVRAGIGERQRRVIGQDYLDGILGDLAGRAGDFAASVDDARHRYRAALRGSGFRTTALRRP